MTFWFSAFIKTVAKYACWTGEVLQNTSDHQQEMDSSLFYGSLGL